MGYLYFYTKELFVEIFILNLGLYLGYIIRYVDDDDYSSLSTGFMMMWLS